MNAPLTKDDADKRYMEQPGCWGSFVIAAILVSIFFAIMKTDIDLLLRLKLLEQRVQELETKTP